MGKHLQFIFYLQLFADLLAGFRLAIEDVNGRECWTTAQAHFDEDARSRTLFRFLREVSAAPKMHAIYCLEQISRRGIRIVWPGRLTTCIRTPDCGVEDFVKTCSMMEDVLHKVKNIETAQTDCVLKEEGKRVTVDSAGPKLIKLRFGGKDVDLGGDPRQLFLMLLWATDKLVPFNMIWQALFESRTGMDTVRTRRVADRRNAYAP